MHVERFNGKVTITLTDEEAGALRDADTVFGVQFTDIKEDETRGMWLRGRAMLRDIDHRLGMAGVLPTQ